MTDHPSPPISQGAEPKLGGREKVTWATTEDEVRSIWANDSSAVVAVRAWVEGQPTLYRDGGATEEQRTRVLLYRAAKRLGMRCRTKTIEPGVIVGFDLLRIEEAARV